MPVSLDLLNLGDQGVAITGAGDYAQIGVSVRSAGDFNNDGIEDFIFSGPVTDLVSNGRGVTYLIFGKAGGIGPIDLATLTPSQGFAIYGPAGADGVDMKSAAAGDVNGDGYDDIIIGAPRNSQNGYWNGAAFVLYGHGGTFGTVDLGTMTAQQGATFRATPANQGFAGFGVAGLGDINNDGFDDIAIGASDHSTLISYGGRAYVLFGSAAGFANGNLSTLTPQQGFVLEGTQSAGFAGYNVAGLGDINGDGIDDFAVSALLEDNPNANTQNGNVYVFYGKVAGLASTTLGSIAATDGFVIQGVSQGGRSISAAGDVNGDGYNDIIVSDLTSPGTVLFGSAGGIGTINLAALTASQGFTIAPGAVTGQFGWSVSGAGDVNADGFDDIQVGVHNSASNNAMHVIYGSAGMNAATLGVSDGLILQANEAIAGLGESSGSGDFNGDGFSDVLAGAWRANNAGYAQGAVYAVYGIVPTAAVTRIGSIANQTIRGGPGDDILNGLGGIDALFGAGGNDRLILGTGASGSRIDGGTGVDTLVVGSTVTALASLVGIEALELGIGAGLTLSGSQFASDLPRDLAVSGSGTITVNMEPGLRFQSQNMVFSGGDTTMIVNGTSGNDIFKTGAASHIINAGDGVDQIRGGTFADTINGEAGNDKILGFSGADVLTGGAGNDQFRYLFATDSGIGASADRITDFTIGGDRLNFSLLDTDAATPGIQGFAFVGSAAFSATGAAQLRYGSSGADLLVQADVNGDGIADMEIILEGLAGQTLTGSDFLL
jgi:Ca2+-binding RTX toxin-like protein